MIEDVARGVMNTEDVIIAVASPPGRAWRGIVRLSGVHLKPLTLELLNGRAGLPLKYSRSFQPARLMLDEKRSLAVLTLIAPGPRSYTGEDILELQAPGNPVLLERIVERFIAVGKDLGVSIRRAEGGEFTARAFFNGRIGLTEAEGVAATIAARSDAELRAASMLRTGSLGNLACQLADELASALALVEAGIDFTDEEDVVAITPIDLYGRLTRLHQHIANTLDRAVGMEQLEAIPWVALTGQANAGKSTLFNALLGRERAVVSDVAGTTRDVLIEPLTIDVRGQASEVMLIDLAGIDDDPSEINRLMQQAADDARARAEMVLYCAPADEPMTRKPPPDCPIVRTKCDLAVANETDGIRVSALTGEGIDTLRELIAVRLADRAVSLAGEMLALGPRHEACLQSAAMNLQEAIELVEPVRDQPSLEYPELVAAAMRAGLDDLASLAGNITPDDVLGRIFATFCVGK